MAEDAVLTAVRDLVMAPHVLTLHAQSHWAGQNSRGLVRESVFLPMLAPAPGDAPQAALPSHIDGGAMPGDKAQQLRDAYHRFSETGRTYVRQRPTASILLALAAGYGLFKLLGGRKH